MLLLGLLVCQAALATGSASESYVLGAGDLIRIQVYGEPDLTFEVRIDEKGTITYPFLGTIQAAGRSVAELRDVITSGLANGYLVDPQVQVVVVEYRPFYVIGAVRQPGAYEFVPGLTVREAVALAGGLTDRASKDEMYLIQEGHPASDRHPVSMQSEIGPGDTLVVEEGIF